ncbi:MAG TPA: hypothetical protein ENN35_02885 [Deltaproteobacteria bacterium]|nr:hypothetical protein [Deltaproteobacteria bacterium]
MKPAAFFVSTCAALVFLAGCAGSPTTRQEGSGGPSPHFYHLVVVDHDGVAVEGASVHYTLYDGKRPVKSSSLTTGPDGLVEDGLETSRNRSRIEYRATKKGYYETREELLSDYGATRYEKPVNSDYVRLLRTEDYLDPAFVAALPRDALKDSLFAFIDRMARRVSRTDPVLMDESVALVRIQNRNYLRFAVDDAIMYNVEAFTKARLVGRIFSDTALKTAVTAHETLGDSADMLFGYDVRVLALVRSFCDPEDRGAVREYRYLISETELKRHLGREITEDTLMERSAAFLDGQPIKPAKLP